jgi:hypothetical protein
LKFGVGFVPPCRRQHRPLYQHSFRAAIEQGWDAETE